MADTLEEKDDSQALREAEEEEEEEAGGLAWSDVAFILFIGGMLLLNVLGVFRDIFGIDTAIILTLVGGYRIFWDSISRLLRGKIGGDLAVTIAALSALAIGEYVAAAEVILIMLVGGALEEFAVQKTRGAIARLLKLTPPVATVRRDGREEVVPIAAVVPGDRVIVRPGERIPVDGAVLEGRSAVDQSALTGESMPVDKEPGAPVFTGTINTLGMLEIRAERVGDDTTLAQVIRMVEEAEERKAPIERLADRWSSYFVPVLLVAAGTVLLLTGQVTRMIAALIVACPCALILATPTAIAAGIGRLARQGTLLKGAAYLEEIGRVDCVVFDKTGTLTEGRSHVAAVVPFAGHSPEEVLQLAATAEQGSTHPIAAAILAEWNRGREGERERGREETARPSLSPSLPLSLGPIEGFRFEPGYGIEAEQAGRVIRVGNRALLARAGIALDETARAALAEMEAAGQTAVLVAEGERAVGVIGVEDQVRADAGRAVAALKALGIRRTVMLTGDAPVVARSVADRLGLDEMGAELFPDAKAKRVRQLQDEGYLVAVLGDGINDAPSLVTANVGIAMGKDGTDIAVEAADIVFMTDELMRLPDTVEVGRLVLRTIRQNILWFAVLLNSLGVLGAGLGIVTPIMAAVGHQIASLCVVCNSLRLLFGGRKAEGGRRKAEYRVPLVGLQPSPWARRWTAFQEAALRVPRAAVRDATLSAQHHQRALGRGALLALGIGWLLSGVYAVRAGQVGVVRRFGKLVAAEVPPGLHYRLPWPVERLACVDVGSVRRVEVGFRNVSPAPVRRRLFGLAAPVAPPAVEPASYEWNTRHQTGFQKRQDESLMLTGDEYLVEVNATVQYRVSRPSDYLFAVAYPEELLRHAAETAIREAVGREPLEAVLTGGRARLEAEIRTSAQASVDHCACGLEILAVRLQDVHPPLEVVNAFRDVASALEEKGRRINEAEAERNAKIPAARAEASRNLSTAAGYTFKRIHEAGGDAGRFAQMVDGNRAGPQTNRIRLYLETVEQVLSGPRKFIVDPKQGGRRQMYLIDGQALSPVPGGAGVGIPGLSVPPEPSGRAGERASGRGNEAPAPAAPPRGSEEESEGP